MNKLIKIYINSDSKTMKMVRPMCGIGAKLGNYKALQSLIAVTERLKSPKYWWKLSNDYYLWRSKICKYSNLDNTLIDNINWRLSILPSIENENHYLREIYWYGKLYYNGLIKKTNIKIEMSAIYVYLESLRRRKATLYAIMAVHKRSAFPKDILKMIIGYITDKRLIPSDYGVKIQHIDCEMIIAKYPNLYSDAKIMGNHDIQYSTTPGVLTYRDAYMKAIAELRNSYLPKEFLETYLKF
jgi:hypothetical protein